MQTLPVFRKRRSAARPGAWTVSFPEGLTCVCKGCRTAVTSQGIPTGQPGLLERDFRKARSSPGLRARSPTRLASLLMPSSRKASEAASKRHLAAKTTSGLFYPYGLLAQPPAPAWASNCNFHTSMRRKARLASAVSLRPGSFLTKSRTS